MKSTSVSVKITCHCRKLVEEIFAMIVSIGSSALNTLCGGKIVLDDLRSPYQLDAASDRITDSL